MAIDTDGSMFLKMSMEVTCELLYLITFAEGGDKKKCGWGKVNY